MKKLLMLLIIFTGFLHLQVTAKWFQQKTIYSKALQQNKTYYIGLPEGYNELDKSTKYPVIIFLHGASVSATELVDMIEPYIDNFLTKILFTNLFKVIFVIPDGSCEPYNGSFYTNSALYGNYEDYIVNDVVEEVATKYNTFDNRAKWCMMGHSMGGYGAMKIALKFPEKFTGISALSGPLNITYYDDLLPILLAEHGTAAPYNFTYSGDVTRLIYTMSGAFSPSLANDPPILFPVNSDGTINQSVKEIWETQNPINLIKGWKGNPAMAIHTYCGEKDEFKLAPQNQMFSDSLDKYKLPHTYKQDPNGDHINSLLTSFPQGLNFLYHVMDTAQIRIGTAVKTLSEEISWSVYPNPANTVIHIQGLTDRNLNLSIHNLSGQMVMQIKNNTAGKGIDISSFQKGIYFLSVQDTKGFTKTIKLLKN